jgi:hypothetical protein
MLHLVIMSFKDRYHNLIRLYVKRHLAAGRKRKTENIIDKAAAIVSIFNYGPHETDKKTANLKK